MNLEEYAVGRLKFLEGYIKHLEHEKERLEDQIDDFMALFNALREESESRISGVDHKPYVCVRGMIWKEDARKMYDLALDVLCLKEPLPFEDIPSLDVDIEWEDVNVPEDRTA